MQSIEQRLDLRDNAFNFIRVAFAVLVIVSHSLPIASFGDDPTIGDVKIGTLALGGFFAISGYLITLSRYRTSFPSYALRRFLRIFPGFWVCLVVTGFGLAALLGLERGGWSLETAARYALSNASMVRGGDGWVGSTLAGAPFPDAMNGSLWTLRLEIFCYFLVGVLLFVGYVRKHRWPFVAAFLAMTALSLVVHTQGLGGTLGQVGLLFPYFAAGALAFRYADRIPLNGVGAAIAGVVLVGICLLDVGRPLGPLPVTYLVIWFAAAAPRAIRRIGSKNDFSYGTYLYAFPVQQVLVAFGVPQFGLAVFTVASVVATAPLAIASWYLVERPAQRLRKLDVSRLVPRLARARGQA